MLGLGREEEGCDREVLQEGRGSTGLRVWSTRHRLRCRAVELTNQGGLGEKADAEL